MPLRIVSTLLMLFLGVGATTAGPVTTLAEVRALPRKGPSARIPVEVVGTVIYFSPDVNNVSNQEGLIMHDGTAGCHIASPVPFRERERIRPGTRIRVKGNTYPQSYFPAIENAQVEVIGQGELPKPRRISGHELFGREVDSDWVEIDAVVVGVEQGGLAFTVVVEIDGRIFKAEVPETADVQRRVAGLMQRRVRLQAVVGTIFNQELQLTGRHFFVPSFDHIILKDGATPEGMAPLRTISSLLMSDQGIEEMVRVRGLITQSGRGGFYLRDESGSSLVQAAEPTMYHAGSMVEVEGYAAVAPFRPVLRAVRIKRLGETAVPDPLRVDVTHGVKVNLHYERVVIDCEFLALRERLGEIVLQCRNGDSYFAAWLPEAERHNHSLRSGDQLRLTGIYEVTTTRPIPRTEWADGFHILLADEGAVKILKSAPWWTPERVLMAFGLVVAALGIVFIWIWQLRRQVVAQSSIIARQIEQAATRDERGRIARELHDTLEQDLTGLSMQLGNLAPTLDGDIKLAHHRLSLARGMLQHCRTEVRASVGDLRDPHLIGRTLPAAMRASLPAAAADSEAQFHFDLHGTPKPLRATTQNHLLRIAREAVFNAARHARPETIRVCLTYDSDGVKLEIIDDGKGFNAAQKMPSGHFGLAGMSERANKIHADFSIESTPGCGTTVRVRLPWSSPVAHPRSQS